MCWPPWPDHPTNLPVPPADTPIGLINLSKHQLILRMALQQGGFLNRSPNRMDDEALSEKFFRMKFCEGVASWQGMELLDSKIASAASAVLVHPWQHRLGQDRFGRIMNHER